MSAILEGAPDKQLVLVMDRAYPELTEKVAECLGTEILETTSYSFVNDEIYVRFAEPVRGVDVFVLQCRSGDINKWTMEQLIMIGALKRTSAKSITVVVPFLGYSRQDRRHRSCKPITTRLILDLFHVAGADRIMMVDLHTAQEQGFFDDPADHLTAIPVLLNYVRSTLGLDNTTIMSPDAGRVKVSGQWATKLGNLPLAFIRKQRDATYPNRAEAYGIIGNVDGRDCVVVDDMVGTTGTICEAVCTLSKSGAGSVTLVATHGLLSGPAVGCLSHCGAHEIVFMDTVPIPEEEYLPNIAVLSYASLLAAGIRSVFEEGSVTVLLDSLPEDMRPCNIYA